MRVVLGYVSVEPWDPTRRVFPLHSLRAVNGDKEDCLAALRRIGVARTRESNRLASLFMVPLMVRPRSLSQPEELRIMIMMPGGALKL